VKKFHPATTTPTTSEHSHLHPKAEQLIFGILQQLQVMYIDACKTRAQTITIKKTAFEAIDNRIQQAYEQVKQPCHVETRTSSDAILDTLTRIHDSVTNLETKYHDIIETKIADTPKTYAEIIKSSTSKDSKIEQRTQKRKQRETLREEHAKYGVTLSTKDTSTSIQQSIVEMPAKTIAERCQQAINRIYVNNADSPRIIGVSKLAKSIRLQFETEEEVNTARSFSKTKEDIWGGAFEGLKVHEPMYGIVVHGVPIADLDATRMTDTSVIKPLDGENNMKAGTITKITPLRRKRAQYSGDKVKLHHSIVVYTNNQHAANKCITNGYYVDYLHYAAEKFTPQYQLVQCFNCLDLLE
jgi:hypothetical protein